MWLLLYLDWIKRVDALLIWFHFEPEQALTWNPVCLVDWLYLLWAGMFQTLWISFRNTREDVCWPWFSPWSHPFEGQWQYTLLTSIFLYTWVNHVTQSSRWFWYGTIIASVMDSLPLSSPASSQFTWWTPALALLTCPFAFSVSFRLIF